MLNAKYKFLEVFVIKMERDKQECRQSPEAFGTCTCNHTSILAPTVLVD